MKILIQLYSAVKDLAATLFFENWIRQIFLVRNLIKVSNQISYNIDSIKIANGSNT